MGAGTIWPMTGEDEQEWSHHDLAGRYVARVRRLADLSQRELAEQLCISQSAIARIEAGRTQPSLSLLSRILVLAELRLVVVDAQGRPAFAVPLNTVRDNQGRRFPMHLDVDPPDQVPPQRREQPRGDRPDARGWYALRPRRDRARGRIRPAADNDHPTREGLAQRRRLMQGRQPRVDPSPAPVIECECLLECYEVGPCLGPCPCQCEPLPWQRR